MGICVNISRSMLSGWVRYVLEPKIIRWGGAMFCLCHHPKSKKGVRWCPRCVSANVSVGEGGGQAGGWEEPVASNWCPPFPPTPLSLSANPRTPPPTPPPPHFLWQPSYRWPFVCFNVGRECLVHMILCEHQCQVSNDPRWGWSVCRDGFTSGEWRQT